MRNASIIGFKNEKMVYHLTSAERSHFWLVLSTSAKAADVRTCQVQYFFQQMR